uniref:POT1A/B-like OB fold domain-containing protein n=1 Tax=Arundo donax TaxID=35708 RepID=A0A0A9CZZ1_ARUDO
MPCVGTVLRVFANRLLKEVFHLQKNIYWARFCNITCKQEFGMWKGILLPTSRVRLLSHEDGSVVDRLKMYDSRIANQVHRQPMASLPEASDVADVEYETAGYTTLMESLTHEQVTHKFKTLVRVVAAYPCRASDLHLFSTGNYCLRLTLEDPTARIYAYVHKDDGVKFFGGFLTAEALIKKMNKLLGIPEDSDEGAPLTRNPPWIWCCLKSYRLDKNNPWGSRRYRIFGTEIRD